MKAKCNKNGRVNFYCFWLVPPLFENGEPFALQPENSEKREPFQTNPQKCEPCPICNKAVPKSATPLRTFARSANPLRIRAQSANPFEVSASACPKARTLCESSPKARTLSRFWRACARKCEPSANLRRKCEPFRMFGEVVPKSTNP